jgi:hypothetical protein
MYKMFFNISTAQDSQISAQDSSTAQDSKNVEQHIGSVGDLGYLYTATQIKDINKFQRNLIAIAQRCIWVASEIALVFFFMGI